MRGFSHPLALFLLVCALLTGCGPDERPPIPKAFVVIPRAPGQIILDGQALSFAEARAELERRANNTRRPTSNISRMIVSIRIESGGDAGAGQMVVDWCQRAGIDLIEMAR